MSEKIWLQSYAPGVPAQVDSSAWPSVCASSRTIRSA